MANIKYFSDFNGRTFELAGVHPLKNAEFATRFPGVRGVRYDGFSRMVGYEAGDSLDLPVTRTITYKSQPSRHQCNSKCLNGKHNGACECQCGGKNHGAGMFTQLLEAA